MQNLTNAEEVVLTDNGNPTALIIKIPEGCFDETVLAVRQTKAMIALESMKGKAAREGFLCNAEINSQIDKARNGA